MYMRSINYRIAVCAAALAVALSAAGCANLNGDTGESIPESVTDTAADSEHQEEPEDEEPDIGEHKDYDKLDAEAYESEEILVVSQDGKKRGFEPFTMTLSTGCLEFYANELNEQKRLMDEKVNVYSMIVPTASELYCPKNERYRIDSQEDIISEVKDMLVGVTQVDVLPTLKNHNAENIYYRSDSRWTPLGAYYAGKVFAKKAGVPYADISEYTLTKPKDYIGDLQYICGPQADADLREHPDEFSFYAPKASYKTNYYDENFTYLLSDNFYSKTEEELMGGYYKGGFYSLKIETTANTGRKLLIVKDEYGTVMPTFFTRSFDEIYVVSYNYLEANIIDFVNDFSITDVLYITNTCTITDQRVYTIETLRTQATHGSLKDDAPEEESDTETDTDSNSDSDSNDTDTIEYIYDVGVNNQVGVVEHSDEDNTTYSEPQEDDTYYEDENNDAGEDDYIYDIDEEEE